MMKFYQTKKLIKSDSWDDLPELRETITKEKQAQPENIKSFIKFFTEDLDNDVIYGIDEVMQRHGLVEGRYRNTNTYRITDGWSGAFGGVYKLGQRVLYRLEFGAYKSVTIDGQKYNLTGPSRAYPNAKKIKDVWPSIVKELNEVLDEYLTNGIVKQYGISLDDLRYRSGGWCIANDLYVNGDSVFCNDILFKIPVTIDVDAYMEGIKSSRKITSAVDGGWEVDSSDVPEALDMFVEYFGEETALEEIARAMGTDALEENIDYIAQQWGFGEDVENMDTAWDKYEYAKELMGTSELFTNLTQAAGYDELTEDLAFIFRQYDFQEWNNRNEEIDSSRKITSSKYEFEIHDMDGYAEYPMTMTDAWDHVFDVSDIDTPYPSYDAWKEDVLEAIDDDEFVNDEYLGELYDYQNDLCNKYYGHDLIANSYDGNTSFEKHRQSGKSFLAYVVSKVGSGEFSEEQAVSTIMRKNNCNSAYARKIFENAMNDGTLVKSGIMEIADEINKEFNVDGDLSSWFEDYVPKDGKSNTVGGELVRAANQIIYRYHNDGDKIGFGTGKETCNPAARYIIEVATDFDMNDEIERMLNGDDYPEDYDVWVDDFKFSFTDYLRDREELFHSVNKDDMWDYKQEDDKDTSVDECYVVDGYGNEYWFDKQGDDWICATVEFAETPEFEVGDVVSEERVAEYVDFDEDDDFIDFANDGFSYSAEKTSDDEWEITNVELENGLANESDYWTIYDFEQNTVYDANGREISTRDLM